MYGYVTRTRTTTHSVQAGCLSSTIYSQSDASISTRIKGTVPADYHHVPEVGTLILVSMSSATTENTKPGIFTIGVYIDLTEGVNTSTRISSISMIHMTYRVLIVVDISVVNQSF